MLEGCHLRFVRGGVFGDLPQVDGLERKIKRFRNLGVKSIVDVRYPGQDVQELSEICRRNGIVYFYYPLNRHRQYTELLENDTLRLFPEFCQIVESGGYYLCDYHEAILALLIYWIFRGADKGLWPSQLFEEFAIENVFLYNSDRSLMGDFTRVVEGMQQRFDEFGQEPLPKEVFDLRMSKVRQMGSLYARGFEGKYSFLSVALGPQNGCYRVSIGEKHLGMIEEPSRECRDWNYSIEYQDQTISGHASSFDDAKKKIFDYIYKKATPEEYLKLMSI